MNVSVIIPALNEAECIPAVVEGALGRHPLEVIVVDNGSTDATAIVAHAAGARVVQEPRRGYGFACAAGAAAAQGDIVVFLDADGSSLPAEMERLVEPVAAGAADLAIGSRTAGRIESGSMPVHQRLGNALVSALMRALFRVAVTDLGPYRAIRRELLLSLDLREMTFGYPSEMMVAVARRGYRMVEVPVTHAARQGGCSKVSGSARGSVLAAFRMMHVVLAGALRR